MLIDDVTIRVHAGNGGRGSVAFQNVKMMQGPTGTSGGRGGSVFVEGVADIGALRIYRERKEWLAENGENGRSQFRDGHDGEDTILKVPVGTVIHKQCDGSLSEDIEITKIGEKQLIAKGGRGGRGNFHFRSSTNTSPRQYEDGKQGEQCEVHIELKLIADVGFVGLPNAGKSSLLNELTRAQVKVANYPFTTLEPNLGAYYTLIIADIPGIIEGASDGKGLGIKFLKHIERTRILFHLVSAESEDVARDYDVIRKELGAHHEDLLKKEEHVFLSKTDAVSAKEVKAKLAILKKKNKHALPLSIHDEDSLKKVQKILNEIQDEKKV